MGCPLLFRANTFVRRQDKFVEEGQRVDYHTVVLELAGQGREILRA